MYTWGVAPSPPQVTLQVPLLPSLVGGAQESLALLANSAGRVRPTHQMTATHSARAALGARVQCLLVIKHNWEGLVAICVLQLESLVNSERFGDDRDYNEIFYTSLVLNSSR